MVIDLWPKTEKLGGGEGEGGVWIFFLMKHFLYCIRFSHLFKMANGNPSPPPPPHPKWKDDEAYISAKRQFLSCMSLADISSKKTPSMPWILTNIVNWQCKPLFPLYHYGFVFPHTTGVHHKFLVPDNAICSNKRTWLLHFSIQCSNNKKKKLVGNGGMYRQDTTSVSPGQLLPGQLLPCPKEP